MAMRTMELAAHPDLGLTGLRRLMTLLKAMWRLNLNPADRVAQRSFMLALDQESLEAQLSLLRRTAKGRKLISSRPALDVRHVPVARLMACAADTLGRALGEHLTRHGLESFPAPEFPPINDLEWMAQRVSDTHDALHALTGYDAHAIGEVELHGFMWAQWRPPTSLIVLPFGFLLALRHHAPWTIWRRFKAGLARGRVTRRVDDLVWEDWLDAPLADLRAHVGLR